jgi:hypothetical protein
VLEKQEMKGEAAAAGDLFCMSGSRSEDISLGHDPNCPTPPLLLPLLSQLESS